MKVQHIPFNFLGIPEKYSSWKNSRFVILPVPYDLTTSYMPGTRRGPFAAIEASTHLETFDEELKSETYKIGIHTMDQIDVPADSPQTMVRWMEELTAKIFRAGKIPVIIGGEHSISPGEIKAAKKFYKDVSVLHFDAHADLRDEFMGTKASHACAAKRISEICGITQVGIRSLTLDQYKYIKAGNTTTFFAEEVVKGTVPNEKIIEKLTDNVYITFDLDVFDPSIMPAVGTPEPGGLDWYKILDILKFAASRRNIVGFDVVELCPIPGNIAPDFLTAKLIYRIIGYIANNM